MSTSTRECASKHNTSHSCSVEGEGQAWESSNDGKPFTLEAAVEMLMLQFAQTRMIIKNFREDINNQINSIKINLDRKLTALQQDVHSLKTDYAVKFSNQDATLSQLNERVDQIMHTAAALENRNELIISGIPYVSGENLDTHFEAMCRTLELSECSSSSPLVNSRRIKTGQNESDSLICLEFAFQAERDKFFSAYLRKRNLTLRHLGLGSNRRVYINEHLTAEARKVKSAALRLKRAGKLTSVYSRGGVVHVRRSERGPPVAVWSPLQLQLET